MYKKITVLVSVFFFVLSSTNGQGLINIGFKKWMPEDFNPQSNVLLIEESGQSKIQEKAEEYMSDNYPFKYKFVTTTEIESKPKDTLSKYALIFSPIGGGKEGYSYRAILYNRETQKIHTSKYNGGYFYDLKSVIKEIKKKFDKDDE